MPRHNKYECNYLLFLEANSKNFKILAMADGGTGLVNGKGESGGKRKRRGKGFRFMAYHWQGLTMVARFGRRRGGRRSVLLRGKRWSVDGMATRSSRADAARSGEADAGGRLLMWAEEPAMRSR